MDKTVTDFGGIYTDIPPVATPLEYRQRGVIVCNQVAYRMVTVNHVRCVYSNTLLSADIQLRIYDVIVTYLLIADDVTAVG